MDILCKVITNLLHVVGILIVCCAYLRLPEKVEDKYRWFKVFIIILIASLIDNAITDPTIALSIYLLWVVIIILIFFEDDIKRLIICAIWVSIIVES